MCSTTVKYVVGNWVRIALTLSIALGAMDIVKMLMLPVHEQGMRFHVIISSPVPCFNGVQFSTNGFFASLVQFIPRYLHFGLRWRMGWFLLAALFFSSPFCYRMIGV